MRPSSVLSVFLTSWALFSGCASGQPDEVAGRISIPSADGILPFPDSLHQAFNPYLPSWEYVPDGEPRVFGDRLYVYGSHDAFDGPDFCVNDYVGWSAPLDDLSDWRYEGVIYKATQDPRNEDGDMHMCAPDCVQGKDGRYYIYYQLHKLQCTSVAVADSPAGPFDFYGYVQHPDGKAWGEKKGDCFVFDPGVLVDDDGKVYLYAGFAPNDYMRTVFKLRGNNVDGSFCMRLDDDMKTVVGGENPIVPGAKKAKGTAYEGHAFFEASSIRKIDGRYYYVYSSELGHELCYAVSNRPDGGFEFGGTLVSIADLGYKGNTTPHNYTGNTHGGMVEIDGQWYVFYHRQTNRIKCSRQGCAEKIEIRPDGSIPQVEVTSCGLNGGPLRGKGVYEARIACNLSGKKGIIGSDNARKEDKNNELPFFTQTGKDRESMPDQFIANMQDGAWCAFKYFRFDGDERIVKIWACGDATGVLKVRLTQSGEPVSEIPISASGEWTEFSSAIKLPSGVAPLYFSFEGEGSLNFYAFQLN